MKQINIKDLFEPRDGRWKWETPEGDRELFLRAYCGPKGPFNRVAGRLRSGYSVLAYVPGNCMNAAAELVRGEVTDYVWQEYGQHPEGEKSLADEWKGWGGITANLRQWVSGKRPGAVAHNLDFLSNDQGGVFGENSAKTAVACLIGGARKGVVLGLADREATALPEPITRAFNEQVRVDGIPLEDFHRIIPRDLGEKLASNGELPSGALWLVASRLRWTDPIRAFRIMNEVNRNAQSLDAVLTGILKLTQTVNFLQAGNPFELPDTQQIPGYSPDLLDALNRQIIAPFQSWKNFQGSEEECRRAISKLPPGLILYGPPGTGKTLLARWIAWRTGLPVRIVSGAEIRAGLWGDAEKNVRNLFRDARRAAPCIIVLDDADDLIPDRSTATGSLAGAERAVVNEFLQQLQGFEGRLQGVLVILTTNRFDALDKAALERLAIHHRVPYPDRTQVEQLVSRIAELYGYDVDNPVCQALVDRFSLPRRLTQARREDADKDYFSPREIETAMRMLETFSEGHSLGKRYRPTPQDVKRVLKYYEVPGTTTAADLFPNG